MAILFTTFQYSHSIEHLPENVMSGPQCVASRLTPASSGKISKSKWRSKYASTALPIVDRCSCSSTKERVCHASLTADYDRQSKSILSSKKNRWNHHHTTIKTSTNLNLCRLEMGARDCSAITRYLNVGLQHTICPRTVKFWKADGDCWISRPWLHVQMSINIRRMVTSIYETFANSRDATFVVLK